MSNAQEAACYASLRSLSPKLQQHQVQGVQWMLQRELRQDMASCGVLADNMGCGKTTLAALLSVCPRDTLIVVTLTTLTQWQDAIASVTGRNPHVLIRGSACDMPPADPSGGRVAITTYSAIESHYCSRACAGMSVSEGIENANTVNTRTRTCTHAHIARPHPHPHERCMMARHWGRVVLDEGHIIRNKHTSTFKPP
jgi:transcription termination factor 2